MMNKTQNKNRKHPTCSRCRFHGKKDIRVLQHQCPFRNCTCSSCFLIKRRSIIYRAQKNLDKTEELSNDAYSPGGSTDGMLSNNYNETNGKNGSNFSVSRSSDSSSDISGHTCYSSEGSVSCGQPWKEMDSSNMCPDSAIGSGIGSCSVGPQVKSSDHYRISDFQSLCLTFPELTASQLQSIFEQCGNDFQKTIDRVLMSKWCNDTDCKTNGQLHNNNDWSATADYASNAISFTRSPNPSMTPNGDPMASNIYNANNGHISYEWRSNGCTALTDDLCASDYGNDYFYDQSSCAVMSTQGNQQTGNQSNQSWNYDYGGYWYSPSQTSHASQASSVSNGSYEANLGNGSLAMDELGWSHGHNALALGPTPEHNV